MRARSATPRLAIAMCVLPVLLVLLGSGAVRDIPRTAASGADASLDTAALSDSLDALRARVERGRLLTVTHACGECHGGSSNPAQEGWLAGMRSPDQEFLIGPCATKPGATPCFRTRPRNLTPDNLTGMGRFSERQVFNALRYGLRPGETPDVEITSTVPGQGNFPAHPKYLAPPMPWPSWRHMPDEDLWAIAAYLKHGVKPVRNKVPDSEGPPDFWADAYTVEKIGPYPMAPFPTAHEMAPRAR